jgi:hypothetical protein
MGFFFQDNYLNNMPQYIYPYTPGGFMMSPQQSWLQQTPVSMPEPHTEMCTPMPFIKQDIATSAGLISRDESIKGYSLSGFT